MKSLADCQKGRQNFMRVLEKATYFAKKEDGSEKNVRKKENNVGQA
jgi:hypothetical protein